MNQTKKKSFLAIGALRQFGRVDKCSDGFCLNDLARGVDVRLSDILW